MKICLECGARYETGWECPGCRRSPPSIDGRLAFAPGLATSSEGFKERYFSDLAPLEASNFWFRARNDLIVWALRRYFPLASSFLEIGCGTGFVIAGIASEFQGMRLSGSEIFSAGLEFAARRVPRATFFQMDARRTPFEEEFDIIGAFDVIEHIREDEQVLAQMFKAVAAGGGIVLTVPQHAFLWSRADEVACHVRRYEVSELKRKVTAAGFRIERCTSFVSLLLPLMFASRMMKRDRTADYDEMSEFRIGALANRVLEGIMAAERALIRAGIAFPMGGSLLLVARKP